MYCKGCLVAKYSYWSIIDVVCYIIDFYFFLRLPVVSRAEISDVRDHRRFLMAKYKITCFAQVQEKIK